MATSKVADDLYQKKLNRLGNKVGTKSGSDLSPEQQTSDVEYCMTKKCIKQGMEMNNYMNRSVDPCESFYDFACNGWENNHLLEYLVQMLSNGGSEYDNFVKVQLKIEENFEKLLTSDDGGVPVAATMIESTTIGLNPDSVSEDDNNVKDPKGKQLLNILPVVNTKHMYRMCVDAPRNVNLDSFATVLNDIGGWPLVTKKFDTNYRWENYFEAVVNRYTDNVFIDIDITVNENSTKHLMLSKSYPLFI